jgi:hypothetical protein
MYQAKLLDLLQVSTQVIWNSKRRIDLAAQPSAEQYRAVRSSE